MIYRFKSYATGAFFILVGMIYGGTAWISLPIGNALSMGPGYFPIILSIVLAALGIAIIIDDVRQRTEISFGKIPWRGLIMLSAATAVFATFLPQLGMMPSVFAATLLSALASPNVRFSKAVIISSFVSALCTLVFIYGVRLPVPVLGSWFFI